MTGLYNIEAENVFVEVEDDSDYAITIVHLHIDYATFKIDGSIYTMLKADGPTLALEDFLEVCNMHKQNNVSNDTIRLRVFKYSLAGGDKTWMHLVPSNYIHTRLELNNQAQPGLACGDNDGGVTIGAPSMSHIIKENHERYQLMANMETNIALLKKRLIENELRKGRIHSEEKEEVQVDIFEVSEAEKSLTESRKDKEEGEVVETIFWKDGPSFTSSFRIPLCLIRVHSSIGGPSSRKIVHPSNHYLRTLSN
ncbi:hypothetical protein HAX54_039723 [Datura stramonium]|uniref:Uncharacterized protein n=1 Tax=Datura stramonium TaxID=4076 RepID=A0ABS8SJP6_DATST|nr:hypothetical protein [Datura stramonium]